MKQVRDTQRKRLYAAEDKVLRDTKWLGRNSEFEAFTKLCVTRTPLPGIAQVGVPTVTIIPAMKSSYGLAWPLKWKIGYMAFSKFEAVAAHEAAHLLHHRWCDTHGVDFDPHGPEFARVYLMIAKRHISPEWASALSKAFSAGGVAVAPSL